MLPATFPLVCWLFAGTGAGGLFWYYNLPEEEKKARLVATDGNQVLRCLDPDGPPQLGPRSWGCSTSG